MSRPPALYMPEPPAPALVAGPLELAVAAAAERALPAPHPVGFDEVYREHFDFVFRNARRLGIRPSEVDDVVQDVFLVVHRRLPTYEPRAPMRAWLYQILVLVISDHRRRARRKDAPLVPDGEGEHAARLPACSEEVPDRKVERADGLRTLSLILSKMSEEKRTVFVLVELEEMSIPEIAAASGDNENTLYTRLRAARREFERALVQHQAQQQGVER